MKRRIRMTLYSLVGSVALLLPGAGLASVCSQGTGIPPFLSSGAKPNLLMVLDNSGSMLDAAYSKTGDIINEQGNVIPSPDNSNLNVQYQRCMDGDYEIYDYKFDGKGSVLGLPELVVSVTGYDYAASYTGYFDQEKWYKWMDGEYSSWQTGTAYFVGERVYANGNIYKAVNVLAQDGKSTGMTIDQDAGVEWEPIFSKNQWSTIPTYAAGDYVWSGPQLYRAKKENTGISPDNDIAGEYWEPKNSTWENDKTYITGNIVTYKGVLYEARDNNTSKIPDEYSKTTSPVWKSLRQGSFQEITASEACLDVDGTEYIRSDVVEGTTTTVKAVCLSTTPSNVTSFTALGKFLNWATASKFDVEKKILTGGKYNYYEEVFVSEHRGCSGSRLIKQVKLDGNGGYLVLGVRGSRHDELDPFMNDRVDTTDDTTRLEILAITDKGIRGGTECQAALEDLADGGSCGTTSSVKYCLASLQAGVEGNEDLTMQMNVLNHSLQFCGSYWEYLKNGGCLPLGPEKYNFTPIEGECENVYTGGANFDPHLPYTIEPSYGAYFCYGVYQAGVSHDERDGYLGRCWQVIKNSDITCKSKAAVSAADGGCDGDPCRYNSGAWYMNKGGVNYKCTFTQANKCELTDTDWTALFVQSNANWILCDPTQGDWFTQDKDDCILKAAIDYCSDNNVPEVIDPSGQGGGATEHWNLPGVLADSGIITQLGGINPLAVMKGYIEKVERPQGILHSVAQELRLGVMSFNYVGSATECLKDNPEGVEKFCPKLLDKDGAKLLAKLESGDKIVHENDPTYPNNDNKRRHVDDLSQAINDIRGTSWTPLGEALYGALGYYTQNVSLCLNFDENGKCLDYPVCLNYDNDEITCVDPPVCLNYDVDGVTCVEYSKPVDDPVQYECQDNHILVITEGESTADINTAVGQLGMFPFSTDDPRLLSQEGDDNLSGDLGTGYDTITGCGDSLYSNTSFDDMTWWGQFVYPLYKNRYIYDYDLPGFNPEKPKRNITTHVVTTGILTATGVTGECDPETLMNAAAKNGDVDATPKDPTGNFYYSGESPEDLERNLLDLFNSIMSRASSGSAASVISDSRSGSGAMYQAVFWPEHEDEATPQPNKVTWVGDVRSLLLDATGKMYEDSDQNGALDTAVDKEIVFYYNKRMGRTRGCYDVDGFRKGLDGTEGTADDFQCPGDSPCPDPDAPDCVYVEKCSETDACVETMDVKYLWSANNQLREMGKDVLTKRKVYTWNDINLDGIVDVDNGEWFLLNADTDWTGLNAKAASAGKRGKVTEDFLTGEDWSFFVGDTGNLKELYAMQSLTRWLLGVDQTDVDEAETVWEDRKLRSRKFNFSDTTDVDKQIWRLGDVIHSAPTAVSKPAEGYHEIYRDPTYSKFARYYDKRRIVIYFGSNDGMLHAVNGGYYLDDSKQFCCTNETKTETKTVDGNQVEYEVCVAFPEDGVCANGKQLGEELWAYIPYNLQPHLKCLAKEFYDHKYFVDLKPRIFDVQIFAEESACNDKDPSVVEKGCIHPGGWGTILVGGMRFGGAPVDAMTLNDFTDSNGLADPRQFTSSYFILDITNPEAEPVLLGELTRNTDAQIGKDNNGNPVYSPDNFVDLNYTTSSPAMIVMRDGDTAGSASTKWYLVMGNGPSRMDGTNAAGEHARLAILPLDWLKGPAGPLTPAGWPGGIPTSNGTKHAVKIPNALPGANEGGVYNVLPLADNAGYVSDIISVDYNIEDASGDALGVRYRTDAVYFATTDGTWHPEYPDNYYVKSGDQRYWNGGGRLFRLVTKVHDSASGKETASTPAMWEGAWSGGNPLRMLADLKAPVVSAPSVGFDGDNYWIYVGTGRFYDELDKTDDGRCLPVNTACLVLGACDTLACSSDPACGATCDDRSNMAYFGIKEPVKDDMSFTYKDWSNVPISLKNVDCYPIGHTYDKDGFDPVMTWGEVNWNFDDPHNTNGKVEGMIPNNDLRPSNPPGFRGLMQTDNILVRNATGYLACWHCYMEGERFKCDSLSEDKCYGGVRADTRFSSVDLQMKGPIFDYEAGELDLNGDPQGMYTFDKLIDYIAGTGCRETTDGKYVTTGLDGWYHVFHDPRERNISTAALLWDMLYFTTYQPFNDKCMAEGQSFLYGLHYQTGTASAEDTIGTLDPNLQDDRGGVLTQEHGNPDPLQFDQHRLTMQGLVMPPTLHSGPDGLSAILTDAAGKSEKQSVGDKKSIRSGRVNWSDQCSP